MNQKVIAAFCLCAVCLASPLLNAQETVEPRVNEILTKLTLDEKIQLIGGVNDFYTHPIQRLNIPQLKMSDGPVGTRNDGPTTAYPAGVALAATWDPAMAQREGEALGRNARARGDHFLLGPGVNICREPQNGRNFEYFGEDPYLAAQMAVGYIQGVQSMGVAACVKHFACNNQETERDTINAVVDERTLHEIYLPAFEAAVTQAKVQAVMAAYNRVNGDYMTANHTLLTDVLKHSWGFQGVLMSDWGATHDVVGPVTAGLDLEMPDAKYLNAKNLKALIASGQISPTALDDKIRRLLRVMLTMHWMDRPQKDSTISRDDPQSNATALSVAREAIVLLKNKSNLLPLDPASNQTIVVVGPNASHNAAGGGSSFTKPFSSITVLQGLRAVARKNINIIQVPFNTFSTGNIGAFAQASKYEPNESDGELQAAFFNNPDLSGPAVKRTDHLIHFNWGESKLPIEGITTRSFSARWTGKIRPSETGSYAFVLCSDDGSRVKLDGQTILDDWTDHAIRIRSAAIQLKGGEPHDLAVEYFNDKGDASIDFGWGKQPELLSASAVQQITTADAVIACVGTDESEGSDRAFELPGDQQELLKNVAALNPKTIVVLNAGGNVAMADWIEQVPAVLDAWFAGQAGGQAIVEILFGQVNPSGHLPDTFEKQWSDSPAYDHYPGQDGKVQYSEGIYVGYRWFDSRKIEPRFPFGYGLSYSTFSMSDLTIQPASGNREYTASLRVTNTSKRVGATIAQLYVRPPSAAVDHPFQELKGFARVELQPGESKTVSIPLNQRAFSFWDVASHGWKVQAGNYEIAVGESSRDIQCTGSIALK